MPFKRTTVSETYVASMRDKSKPVGERPNFNPLTLKHTMLAPFESFIPLGVLGTEVDEKYPGRHIYIDRGSSVLGVAHLDSVNKPTHFWCNNAYIASPTIDNRLGVWILLHGLPSIGIYPDVLLTENEESCNSTGEDFRPAEMKWNWMFSFDRMNEDVVLYQYGWGKMQDAIKKAGFTVGQGSYSDISSLGHLGIEGANFGCGMQNYHSPDGYTTIKSLENQLQKFSSFYADNKETKFAWEERKSFSRKSKRHQSTTYSDYYTGDDMFGYGRGTGYGYPTHTPTGGVTPARREILASGLRVDIGTSNKIIEEGFGKFIDYFSSPQAFRNFNALPTGSKPVGIKKFTLCRDCDEEYDYRDVQWSSYYGRNFCKACFLERMELLDLLPTTWLEEIKAVALANEEKEETDVPDGA